MIGLDPLQAVQSGAHCTMIKETTPKRIRLTISVKPEVHATFERLATASGSSISWAMGEWLADTLEASEQMTQIVERAKSKPAEAINHLQSMLAAAERDTADLMATVTARQAAAERPGAGRARTARSDGLKRPGAGIPPASNTGGKGTHKGGRKPT